MHSRRTIEDLTLMQIVNFLKERYKINNTIINNASIETSEIKQRYGERLLSFFNIILAAALISSFILYNNSTNYSWILGSNLTTFLLILSLSCFVLLVYAIAVFIKFFTQYFRQRIYRDINNEILIILNNASIFFCGKQLFKDMHISIETLNDFFKTIYFACKTKNKTSIHKYICQEWKGILIGIILDFIMALISLILAILLRC